MIGLPSFWEHVAPLTFKENPKTMKLLTGASIAVIESFILCPFERLKTYFMTGLERDGMKGYIENSKGHRVRDLFKGTTSLMAR